MAARHDWFLALAVFSAAHLVVLAWLGYHPGDTPQGIAGGLGANVDDILMLCDELAGAGLIVPPRHQ